MAVRNFFLQDGLNVNNFVIANTTTLAVGSNLSVNATALNINAIGVYANSSIGTNGQFLASNGTSTYWAVPTASATAGGPNTAIQYANGTAIAGNGNFTYDYSAIKMAIGGASATNVSINSSSLNIAANLTINTTALYWTGAISIYANGALGTANQVLTSNGTTAYWANSQGGSTSSPSTTTWLTAIGYALV